ncbi:MAG: CoA activase [Deltaproteobacteria bacterium]|nr:CoA activase [Deltaproteobacteria bacterium]MBN2672937.1 CoA activase [Deltaproteobacteria bacterium]
MKRTLGIDIGAETIKVVELTRQENQTPTWTRRSVVQHHKEPVATLEKILADYDWSTLYNAAVTGRLSRTVNLSRIPIKQSQIKGFEFLFGDKPATIVSIGSHGFSVLELRDTNIEMFRENSRCSQGTGNFLRQLVERFDMSIEDASALCTPVKKPAPLSGRCPVILKTDMTHLANKGEPRERILAGLFDAVCENVQVLIKPRVSPKEMVLIGGVTQAPRIQANFQLFAEKNGMSMLETGTDDNLYFEALGCASIALTQEAALPTMDTLFNPPEDHALETLPPLSNFLDMVERLKAAPKPKVTKKSRLILGFDIGSTGSKVVAVDAETKREIWEAYINTNGAPVAAAQNLMEQFANSEICDVPVVAVGATGSGREIVGSLLTTCYGAEKVFVLNEIAAHAEGAIHFDNRVDTIFEIGGQDAKYIRLTQGRVVDAAMNEACSAGTGSFIEEQGKKFQGIQNVIHLADEALQAEDGVSLGQHCSVFMAEIIDEAVASHVPQRSIIAGIYDSIIQNYLNRVKGSRSVGKVIFCQGMPFSSDALAASVARQTGAKVIVPPNPGTVGALGIALLSMKELKPSVTQGVDEGLDVQRFLNAEIVKKDVFTCKSTKGCGGSGNYCRIDRITTLVEGVEQKFTWGGGCSLYDKGTGKKKLPDLAPNPFKEREQLVLDICEQFVSRDGRPTIAVTDQFVLKSMFPFFTTFLYDLGFNLELHMTADQATLKRGIEDANVPFCAPMQQYHGIVSEMAETQADYLFLPMVRGTQRIGTEPWARLCPIVQGSADMLISDLGEINAKIISPIVNIGKKNFESPLFMKSMKALVEELGVSHLDWKSLVQKAAAVQEKFDRDCITVGEHALDFCDKTGVTPVVVLGRTYTIYNDVLNSNVPNILREQGAIGIPVDCYPLAPDAPIFPKAYWGYGQRNLRSAHQIRRTPGLYSLFCSNYSCGPDSFNVHFYNYIMEGKPAAIIETDGHSGDAGTKTRIEAFLYCVHEDQSMDSSIQNEPRDFMALQTATDELDDIMKRDATVLLPRMGPGAETLSGALRGLGMKAESLPLPDAEALSLGRRYTSGKECFPMVITLGSFLQRVLKDKDTDTNFTFFMPTANGPCRFGAYNVLDRIVFERLGILDKVGIWAPVDDDYFETVPDAFAAVAYAALASSDYLLEGLYTSRPVENRKGAAEEIWNYYRKELENMLEEYVRNSSLSMGVAISNIMSGSVFGITDLLKRAAKAYRSIMVDKDMPEVLVTGEMYVRCDPFSNDFVIDQLEKRGIRCKFAPFNEWLEYTDYQDGQIKQVSDWASSYLQGNMQHILYYSMADEMGWHTRTTVQDALVAAKPYIRESLSGESVLTIGGPLHEWRQNLIDGMVSVGPLECMPNKISENQLHHISEREGLPNLTLYLNGDPVDPEILDNFAYEIHAQFKRRKEGKKSLAPPPVFPRPRIWKSHSKFNPKDN